MLWNEENARLHLGNWRFSYDGYRPLPLLRCSPDNREARANAHLMAAAPEMLAALRDLLSTFAGLERFPADSRVARQARAVIANAEGSTEGKP